MLVKLLLIADTWHLKPGLAVFYATECMKRDAIKHTHRFESNIRINIYHRTRLRLKEEYLSTNTGNKNRTSSHLTTVTRERISTFLFFTEDSHSVLFLLSFAIACFSFLGTNRQDCIDIAWRITYRLCLNKRKAS